MNCFNIYLRHMWIIQLHDWFHHMTCFVMWLISPCGRFILWLVLVCLYMFYFPNRAPPTVVASDWLTRITKGKGEVFTTFLWKKVNLLVLLLQQILCARKELFVVRRHSSIPTPTDKQTNCENRQTVNFF